jgi:hypothetical protein
MGTKARRITTAIAITSVVGVAAVAGTLGSDAATVRTTQGSAIHASADALEHRILAATAPRPACDPGDFNGSADAYDRLSAGCVEPVVVFYGSPDSVERQAGG